jgi:uncharacterized membrane protein HdeD (DUF308 family)
MTKVIGLFDATLDLPPEVATARFGKNWQWILGAGIAYVSLGTIAILVPIASTMDLNFAVAGLLGVSSAIHLVEAVKWRHVEGVLVRFLLVLLPLVVGGIIFAYPGIGMLGIALSLGLYFLLGAALKWFLAEAMVSGTLRAWVFVGVAASFLLGIYILMTFPFSALWVPGLLLGIELLFGGTGVIGYALSVRKLYSNFQEGTS